MAHELYYDEQNGQYSFAYREGGGVAWHGLGQPLPDGADIEAWKHSAGFNWTINESPCLYRSAPYDTGPPAIFEGQKVLYRSDTGDALSVVTDRYHVVQPQTILEQMFSWAESANLEIETAGILRGGRRFWALAKNGNEIDLRGDKTLGYVLFATSADKTLATQARNTAIRVVCSNTLSYATYQDNSEFKLRHNRRLDAEAIAEAETSLGLVKGQSWDDFAAGLEKLAATEISDKQATRYFSDLLRPPKQGKKDEPVVIELPGARPMELVPVAQESERRIRGLENLEGLYRQGPGAPQWKGTAYGAFQAMTRYVDHERGKDRDRRMDSAFFGQGANLKNKAWDAAFEIN